MDHTSHHILYIRRQHRKAILKFREFNCSMECTATIVVAHILSSMHHYRAFEQILRIFLPFVHIRLFRPSSITRYLIAMQIILWHSQSNNIRKHRLMSVWMIFIEINRIGCDIERTHLILRHIQWHLLIHSHTYSLTGDRSSFSHTYILRDSKCVFRAHTQTLKAPISQTQR